MGDRNNKPEALRLADKYARHYTACEMAIVFCNSDADTAHKKKLTDEAREALYAEIQRLTAELDARQAEIERLRGALSLERGSARISNRLIDELRTERDALHARIAGAENQKPVAWRYPYRFKDIGETGAYEIHSHAFAVVAHLPKGEPLFTRPIPAPAAVKDHEIAQAVNELRDIAVEFHGHQSLRQRISQVAAPLLRRTAPAAGVPDDGRPVEVLLRAIELERLNIDLRFITPDSDSDRAVCRRNAELLRAAVIAAAPQPGEQKGGE